MREVAIIGVASGLGARDRRCEEGPDALLASGPASCFNEAVYSSIEMLRPRPTASLAADDVLRSVVELNQRLAEAVQRRVQSGKFPVVIGGDHSCAIGTWSGVCAALGAQGPLGLLWIDAHMDSHIPLTSPSGALHGMPLACLLGHGEIGLTHLAGTAPKLHPAHVCLLGVRSFEAGEAALLRRLGVRVYFMDEIIRRGLAAVWREALKHVAIGTAAYGVSIDLDAVDPCDAPGVGSPAPGGLAGDVLVQVLAGLQHDQRLAALEIAEYNPRRDKAGTTLNLLRRMMCAVGAGEEPDEPHHRPRAAILRP